MKNNILAQVLAQDARARLNTIALTKPEKAKMVEGMLMQMAQTGQIQGKVRAEFRIFRNVNITELLFLLELAWFQ